MEHIQLNDWTNPERTDFATCWKWNDERRNQQLDDEANMNYERAVKPHCDHVRNEARALWQAQQDKVEENASEPMPISFGSPKCCLNDHCPNEVSWQFVFKSYCAGDCCVEQLVPPSATQKWKQHVINMALKQYWTTFEKEMDVINPTLDPLLSNIYSPTSVMDDIEQDGMFSMDDIVPMDLDEMALYCDETLSCELKEAGCDKLVE